MHLFFVLLTRCTCVLLCLLLICFVYCLHLFLCICVLFIVCVFDVCVFSFSCSDLKQDQAILLLYMLLHENTNMAAFIFSRSDVENLVNKRCCLIYCLASMNMYEVVGMNGLSNIRYVLCLGAHAVVEVYDSLPLCMCVYVCVCVCVCMCVCVCVWLFVCMSRNDE